MGLLKLVMDGLEFLALRDTCVHGLLHSLNAFSFRAQLMTHLIEEGIHKEVNTSSCVVPA